MNSMLIGIGAVIVLVILAAVFMMSKRRSTRDASPSAVSHRPKTLAEQQLELEQQRQQAASMPQSTAPSLPSAEDALANAQRHLEQQDYSTAANTLKEAIKHHPRRADLQVQLLNVFAQAKNYDNFNRFYPQVLKLNDPQATLQANKLKNLLDDELAFSQQSSSVSSVAPIAAVAATAVAAQPVAQAAESLDFDFFDKAEENLTSTTPTTTASSSAKPVSDELDFDLDFDEPTAQPASVVTPASTAAVHTTQDTHSDIDFDFDIDTPTSHSSPVSSPEPVSSATKEISLPDGGEISFDDFDLSPEASTSEPVQTPIVQSPISQTPTINTAPATEEIEDFDFNFDEPSVTNTPVTNSQPIIATVVEPTHTSTSNTNDDLDFGDFNFEENNHDDKHNVDAPATTIIDAEIIETHPSTPTSIKETGHDTALDEEFNLDFDLPQNDSASSSTEHTPTSHPVISETANSQPKVEDNVVFDDFNLDFDANATQDKPTTQHVIETPVVETVSPTHVEPHQVSPSNNQSTVEDEVLFDDFDMDFDTNTTQDKPTTQHAIETPVVETVSPTHVEPQKTSLAEDDFDIDFNIDEPTQHPVNVAAQPIISAPTSMPAQSVNEVEHNQHNQDEVSFDDFDLDLDNESKSLSDTPIVATSLNEHTSLDSSNHSTIEPKTEDDFLFDDLTLDVPTEQSVVEVAQSPVVATSENELVGSHKDAINLVSDTPAPSAPVSMPVDAQPVVAPASNTSVNETPVASVSGESPVLANVFDLLKDIDTNQLNIDLAEQYVNLGEYDSAKRLLDEVNVANSPQYQAKVQQLIEKIG